MTSLSSYNNESQYNYRQGSMVSLPDEDDENTMASDPSTIQRQRQESSLLRRSPSTSISLTGHVKIENVDATPSPNTDFLTSSMSNNEDTIIRDWPHLTGDTVANDQRYPTISQSDSANDVTTSFGFHQTPEQTENNYDFNQQSAEEISHTMDYETLIRTKQLYFDPNPETIRKPQMINPIIYKQNIMIKFLKPPSVPQGPLIIREIRPPQPAPPPPLVIRQRAPPPLSPPPLILREKPPRIPVIMTAQVLTKNLPPLPAPPRSVIIEKLPAIPPKPRDIIIERWIPYESSMQKRKIVVERAEEVKPYPPPKNIIIQYERVEPRIIRQFRRLGVTPADPENYTARFGNSLLATSDLLAHVKQLGISEDLSLPRLNDNEFSEKLTSNQLEENFSYENSLDQNIFEKISSQASISGTYTPNNAIYTGTGNSPYSPTFENLVHGNPLLMNFDELNEHSNIQGNMGEDLSTQLAQYGLTTESIPY
ncbi:unnamed protein product [Adineta steineri]|uniref:Uncharacterized protein n=1 Tax=Adineta steineri TaxID=433720 RepID=A0A818SN25_9BILA|nr:unnamed protein product [Adineta steineri]CAF1153176.1 unnamed protein product [Adineta steineri]CAF3669916.1 unnamed protein product [Adineta steineri]CAF3719556.1 unnamed protein product [Adineta steineri]